jgi:hypothetical protein
MQAYACISPGMWHNASMVMEMHRDGGQFFAVSAEVERSRIPGVHPGNISSNLAPHVSQWGYRKHCQRSTKRRTEM